MIHIITGGTYEWVRPHFCFCAPAFGTVGTELQAIFRSIDLDQQVSVIKTKMVCGQLSVARAAFDNKDLAGLIEDLCAKKDTKALILAAAVCDWVPVSLSTWFKDGTVKHDNDFGKDKPRLSTRDVEKLVVNMVPAPKVITRIKEIRPDITLVGFKTTTGFDYPGQIEAGSRMLDESKADFVFCNDLETQNNILICNLVNEKRVLYSGSRIDGLAELASVVKEVCFPETV